MGLGVLHHHVRWPARLANPCGCLGQRGRKNASLDKGPVTLNASKKDLRYNKGVVYDLYFL